MKRIENLCYDCPRPCAGCGRNHMEVRICDDCCDSYAEYIVDGDDLCEDCLTKRVKEVLAEWTSGIQRHPEIYLKDVAEKIYDEVEEV